MTDRLASAERERQRGYALITVMILAALVAGLLAVHFALTRVELQTTSSSMDGTRGFYAAEAGVNLRALGILQTFQGYNRPAGSGPSSLPGQLPCAGSPGTGDFACQTYPFEGRQVETYLSEAPDNPTSIVIPPGEAYQNLQAQEYLYTAHSVSVRDDDRPEAILAMHFRSRLVPLFQFAAFYDKDLEILPSPDMTLRGPIHTNGDLYVDAGGTLSMEGQVTAAGRMFKGRKNEDSCSSGPVTIHDPTSPLALPGCSSGRTEVASPAVNFDDWNGMLRVGVEAVTVPPPELLDPVPGATYWDKADLRVLLDLQGGSPAVVVRDVMDNDDATGSATLAGCGAVSSSTSFFNHRESRWIDMLDVDVQALLDCIQINPGLQGGRALDDTTEGGLVWYLGVDGPFEDTFNGYGVRMYNGGQLASSIPGAPAVAGLTVVTDQAMYVEGDYNATPKRPAAFLADSLNVLSNAWDDSDAGLALDHFDRKASATTINAAFLAGTDTTGDAEGPTGQDSGDYNGGLENYPRFHESWSGVTFTYRGSFVSLDAPRHVSGAWQTSNVYNPPVRDWAFDTDFSDAANLPPLSPRFVYLKQDLFTRQFGL